MIEGKAIIKFGTGDILITPMVKQDMSAGCVVLQNKGTHVIGEYSPASDFVGDNTDTVISFSKAESIDVLIERLHKLKSMMNGNLADCTLGVEYEY